jgi:2-polyprenyl-3-methyl-5-hydroxy-6-metoxy-1,4-benzoquinol methylase
MTITVAEFEGDSRDELVDLGGKPVVLNLGCGKDERGIGIDIHYEPDIFHNLNEGIPVNDDSADVIIAEHVLEHLENPTQFFRECRRVLRDDGELRLEVPNVGWLPVRSWLSQDLHRFWRHKDPNTKGHWLARRLGNTDEERTRHRSLWTKALLEQYLDNAGFSFEIEDRHWSRNLSVRATPGDSRDAQTLHELERAAGEDMASEDYWAQTRARIIRRWIGERDPQSVLDVGCGSGYLTAEIARVDPQRKLLGIDINEDSIQVAKRRDTPARFEVGDAFDLPAGEYDCVVYGDVLEHFDAPEELLAQGRQTLSSDGAIIVSVPAFQALYGPHDEHNGHAERYDRERLHQVAQQAGLRVERSQFTNVVPLVPYFIYQRVLRRRVPDSARGSHGKLLSALKSLGIRAETRNPLPLGITLLAELKP